MTKQLLILNSQDSVIPPNDKITKKTKEKILQSNRIPYEEWQKYESLIHNEIFNKELGEDFKQAILKREIQAITSEEAFNYYLNFQYSKTSDKQQRAKDRFYHICHDEGLRRKSFVPHAYYLYTTKDNHQILLEYCQTDHSVFMVAADYKSLDDFEINEKYLESLGVHLRRWSNIDNPLGKPNEYSIPSWFTGEQKAFIKKEYQQDHR